MEVNAQEKYYLSRFRPLTGMVLSSRIYKRSPVQFSPPCGDCTDDIAEVEQLAQLSPPYGDCTKKQHAFDRCTVIAPLRGWYQVGYAEPDLQCVFAPLRGLY
mgnify:CR=1 FL=1